ncbi:MAG: maiA [Proteobacteria bacterium]|nr:maiA [Pseudomonadota bacterium]
MKLYTYYRSSAAYRVRIALNVKELGVLYIPKHLLREGGEHQLDDYLALNPQGLVPALEHQGRVIGQSLAIIEYLDEIQPEPPLLPDDPGERAVVRSMAMAIACDIHPLNNLRVLNYLKGPLGHDEAAVGRWYAHWVAEGFRGLEEMAKRSSADGRHLYGGSVTLADVVLVPQMYNARRFRCDLAPYPTLVAISTYLESLPPFQAARPEAQPDAEA